VRGNPTQSIAYARRVIAADASMFNAYFTMADAYALLGDDARALEAVRRVLLYDR